MVNLHSHHDISAPRDTIWGLLMDFGNIQAWWPANTPIDIERVELEGSGVGMIRHIYNVGFEGAVSERLDSLDLANYTLQLSIVGARPAGQQFFCAMANGHHWAPRQSRCHSRRRRRQY